MKQKNISWVFQADIGSEKTIFAYFFEAADMCLYFHFIPRLRQNSIFMAKLGLRSNEQKAEKVINHSAYKEDRFAHQTSGQSIEQKTKKGDLFWLSSEEHAFNSNMLGHRLHTRATVLSHL